MREFLNTDEAADYLRLSERKLYELVSTGSIPCSKVTGRWLFPRAALNRWVAAGMAAGSMVPESAPPIVGGSHDPLLEWALRESLSGLASLPEGSENGLRRLARRDVVIAAIHLHALTDSPVPANVQAVTDLSGLHDAVVIAFARREQGLIVAPGNPHGIDGIGRLPGLRLARRQDGAGAHLLLLSLLEKAGIALERLTFAKPDCVTGAEVTERIRLGEVECGVATHAVAQSAGMSFVPLLWENFDLVLRQRDYFLPGPQALFEFIRSKRFRGRAAELGGYDTGESGHVRHVN